MIPPSKASSKCLARWVISSRQRRRTMRRKRLLAGEHLRFADYRHSSPRVQRTEPGAPGLPRSTGNGTHHHLRLRRDDDGGRGRAVRRGVRAQANQAGRVSQDRGALPGRRPSPTPMAAQARGGRISGDRKRPPGRGGRCRVTAACASRCPTAADAADLRDRDFRHRTAVARSKTSGAIRKPTAPSCVVRR